MTVEANTLGMFVLASLALIALPGQDMIYVMTRSLAQGRFAGLCSAVGVCLGIVAHTGLAALGVGAILMASEGLFFALKLLGAAYLAYLGIRLMLTRAAPSFGGVASTPLSPLSLVWQGALSNLTNPKIVLFFFAYLPQFVDPASASPTRELVFLGLLYALLALPVKAAVGFAAGSLSERVIQRPATLAWINRFSGAVLLGLGLRLATTER